MPNTGIKYPFTVDTVSEANGDCVWVTASNVISDNTQYAGVTAASFDTGILSFLLRTRNYNASVPATATITGFLVEIEGYDSAGAAGDADVVFTKNGTTRIGEDKALGAGWTSSPAIHTFGSSSDLWATTWTVGQVNSASFGVLYKMSASGVNTDGFLDFIRTTIYYEDPASPTVVPPTINLITAPKESLLSRNQISGFATLKITTFAPTVTVGGGTVATPITIALILKEFTGSLGKTANTTVSSLNISAKESYLSRTFGVPLTVSRIGLNSPVTNKGFSPGLTGLITDSKRPIIGKAFIPPSFNLTFILNTPVVTTSSGATIRTPATIALITALFGGNLALSLKGNTTRFVFNRYSANLNKTNLFSSGGLSISEQIPITGKGFIPPAIALSMSRQGAVMGKGFVPVTLVVSIGRNQSYLNRISGAPQSSLLLNRTIPILDKGFVPVTLPLELLAYQSRLDRLDTIPALGLILNEQTGHLEFALNVTSEFALIFDLQTPSVITSASTDKIVTPSTFLLILQSYSPGLLSGIFPLATPTGRYGAQETASWEGILTETGRYGLTPSVSNEGILTASGRYGLG